MHWPSTWRNKKEREMIMIETAEENPLLQLSRLIAAPRERVFTAWTTPEAIKVWFGPADCRVVDAQVDLRVGGEFCFSLSTVRLGEIKVRGRYREVTPPTKLIYTWQWEGHPELVAGTSLVSVQFIAAGTGTEIRLTHAQLPTDESRGHHGQGWSGTFDKLEKYLVS
jgi:uncharacterized protein YndB with AHSA1/START domain